MIVRFAKAGRSFSGVAQYLLHDTWHAKTSERVAWSHTLNCAHDEVGAAVREMISTWRNSEQLKLEAGIRGGRTERPVKHVSLNWHPSEVPDREAMIAAAQGFLKSMDWERQQAVLIAHTDRAHRHVHIVLSAIDPDTGRKIDDGLEFRRAQKWAAQYERERGQEFCPQRGRPVAYREAPPPRPVWRLLEESLGAHRQAEAARLAGLSAEADAATSDAVDLEWKALKQLQREAREGFFADGRKAYAAARDTVYREVRGELRSEWRDLYAAARAGADRRVLGADREALIERQMTMLRERAAEACGALRQERDAAYREILNSQKEARASLRTQQARSEPAAGTLGALAEDERRRYVPALAEIYRPGGSDKGRELPDTEIARWTERGGMVAQQGSARRWLDRLAARGSVEKTSPGAVRQSQRAGSSGQDHPAVEKRRTPGRERDAPEAGPD